MDLIHIGSRSPCTPFSSSLHDTTFSRQSTPHFLALFQPPVRNPQETQGNPHSCSGNPEVTPLNAFTHPLRPYKAFTLHRAFRFWAQTPRRLHSIGRRQHTTLEHTFRARQLDACAEDVMPPGTQDPLATLTTPYKSKPVGFEPTRGDPIGPAGQRLSRSAKVSSARRSKSAAFESRQSCDCQSLLLVPPSPRHLARSHRLMRTVCISRESNPGQMATMYSTTRPLMPLENLWT